MLLRMRYGFYSPNFGGTGDPRFVAELGARAEAAGWDGFFLWDHLAVQPAPLVDPWVALAAVAVQTERGEPSQLIVPLAAPGVHRRSHSRPSRSRGSRRAASFSASGSAPRTTTRASAKGPDWRTRAAKLDDGLALVRRLAAAEERRRARPAGSAFSTGPVEFPVWAERASGPGDSLRMASSTRTASFRRCAVRTAASARRRPTNRAGAARRPAGTRTRRLCDLGLGRPRRRPDRGVRSRRRSRGGWSRRTAAPTRNGCARTRRQRSRAARQIDIQTTLGAR